MQTTIKNWTIRTLLVGTALLVGFVISKVMASPSLTNVSDEYHSSATTQHESVNELIRQLEALSYPAQEKKIVRAVIHKGYAEDSVVQNYVNYAWEISNGDLEFIATLDAENGQWNPHRQSEVVKNGIREDSWGFCQIHRRWHRKIVDDSRFWNDRKRQIDRCRELYLGGTAFYGRSKVYITKHRFTIIEG